MTIKVLIEAIYARDGIGLGVSSTIVEFDTLDEAMEAKLGRTRAVILNSQSHTKKPTNP